MAWIYLIAAGMCEMVWPLGYKYTKGFTVNWWAVVATFAVMLVSFWFLGRATRLGVHIGTAYAVWTGIGAAGTAAIGMIFFNEPRDWLRMVCLMLIICGAVGLKFFAPGEVENLPRSHGDTEAVGNELTN